MSFVLMADIIGSRKHDEKELMDRFSGAVNRVNESCSGHLLSPLTVTLGDEFQGVLDTVKGTVETIIQFEETLVMGELPFQLRYAVQEGPIETPIDREKAHGMMGRGLTEGRELLESMKGSKKRMSFRLKDQDRGTALEEGFLLYQWIVDGWNGSDRELVRSFWQHKDYKKVAKVLGKNVSLMWKRERSLKLREYSGAKKVLLYIAS